MMGFIDISFTVTVNYDSSQSITVWDSLNSLLDYERLHFRCDERLLTRGTHWTPESESYVTTDGQPASLSWNKAPIWGLRPDFYIVWQLRVSLIWGALSDERTGLSFTIAAGLASAVIFGSGSRRTLGDILLSQIRDFPFRLLLRLAGSRWRYSTPPPHGYIELLLNYDSS
jgi:hypothetical protein